MEWAGTALAEAGCELLEVILARKDQAEADLRAYYTCPDVAASCSLEMEEGTRWPYPRAHALRWERGHPGPRSAARPEELRRKIDPAMAAMRRAS